MLFLNFGMKIHKDGKDIHRKFKLYHFCYKVPKNDNCKEL